LFRLQPNTWIVSTTGKPNHNRSAIGFIFCIAGLLIAFFLPWVAWKDSFISGYHMPSGRFFHVAETKFNLGNPVPQLNFTFYVFWLIPVLAAASAWLAWQNKKTTWTAFIAGALTLSLVTVFYLFTKTLTDLSAGNHVFSMLKIPAYLSFVFAAGLILTAMPAVSWYKKAGWLLAGPLFAFLGFMIIEKKVWSETHADTDKLKADYTVTAAALIRDFAANDTAANNKYREKILVVDGAVSRVEMQADSTVNIKFVDTSKHFINISLDKKDYEKTKSLKPGDLVSVKGSCSGSSYSMILDSTSIDFKRSTLNKK
jgi:hypothetical protein